MTIIDLFTVTAGYLQQRAVTISSPHHNRCVGVAGIWRFLAILSLRYMERHTQHFHSLFDSARGFFLNVLDDFPFFEPNPCQSSFDPPSVHNIRNLHQHIFDLHSSSEHHLQPFVQHSSSIRRLRCDVHNCSTTFLLQYIHGICISVVATWLFGTLVVWKFFRNGWDLFLRRQMCFDSLLAASRTCGNITVGEGRVVRLCRRRGIRGGD